MERVASEVSLRWNSLVRFWRKGDSRHLVNDGTVLFIVFNVSRPLLSPRGSLKLIVFSEFEIGDGNER